MPGGDRTGPRGEGARTGRGLGYCVGNEQPGYATPRPDNRLWRGYYDVQRGYSGRGRRNRRFDNRWVDWERPIEPTSPQLQEELETLKNQTEELKTSLQELHSRLDELGK